MIIPLREDADYPRLVFVHDVHERDLAPLGYRGDVVVEFANGDAFPIFFYEPTAEIGRFVAEPGLVLLPRITVDNMKATVSELVEIGYFSHLRPIPAAARGTT